MNIVFIMSDDHGYQAISSYDSTLIKTPNIDRLAEEGMLFKQSFVTNSICGPSRAVMLTGKYNHINGMIDNGTTFDGSQQTVNKILKENGYTTAMVGKWHLKSEPIGFDYWNVLPGQGHYYNPDFIEMGEKKRVEGYVTDLITDYALKWLDDRDKKKPFSLFLHHKAPHRNWMPGPDYLNNYVEKEYPIPNNFFDDYANRGTAAKEQTLEIDEDMFIDYDLKIPISEKEKKQFANEKIGGKSWEGIYNRMNDSQRAVWDKAYGDENESFKKSKLKGEDLAKWKYQRYMNDYLRCIASVDDNVGRVIKYLEENGLMENTLIIYTSDQGFYLGEHGWFDKRFMYEESHKTPLIIRSPNGKRNIVNSKDMVVNIDYAPTFLDYAGVEVPDDMQGKSLRQIIENNTAPDDWRKSVYYHYFEYPAEHGVKRHYGIRNSRYKLIHFYYDIDEWEFYDLENDPNEMVNGYENPKYKILIEELKKELELLREEYQDTDLEKYLPRNNEKIDHLGVGAKVSLVNKYSPKYSGGTKNALVDGIKGPDKMFSIIDYSVWQGFEEMDLVATIDLGKTVKFTKISIGFLQCLESWIFLPDWVEYQSSLDNKNFNEIGKVERKSNLKSTKVFREEYSINSQIIKARYIKIHAKNVKVCPEWHKGAGGAAWIFSDEVTIN
jgi:arylsulfatase A-like enzyme